MIRCILFCCCLLLSANTPALAQSGADGFAGALQAAMHNHPAIKGKLAELRAQGYRIDSAKAGRYPNLKGELSRLDDGSDYGTLRLRQPLYAFGKIDTPIERSKAQLEAEQLGLLQVQRQLIEKTAAAYVVIQGVQQQLVVAKENIAEHLALYQQIQRREQGELATNADVQLAYARLAQARSQKERLQGELQIAQAELRSLTQVQVECEKSINPALLQHWNTADMTQLMLSKHADIQYKKKRIAVVAYDVALEKISDTPTLYAEVEQDLFDSATGDETRAGLVLEGSLDGIGFGTVGRIKSAQAQLDAARRDLESTRNDVTLQVTNLLANLRLQERLKRQQEAAVEAVRQTRESYRRQYDSGRKTWLEILNMERELTEQRLQLVQADNQWKTFSLRLAALSGQLDTTAHLATGK